MKSLSHWGLFPYWEQGLPPMVEQPKSWVHVPIGNPYPACGWKLSSVPPGHYCTGFPCTLCKPDYPITSVGTAIGIQTK